MAMVSSVMTWCLVAALGQAASPPAEAAWLKAVPADAGRGPPAPGDRAGPQRPGDDAGGDEPRRGRAGQPALEQGLDQLRKGLGEDAIQLDGPVLLLIRMSKPDGAQAEGFPPSATFVRTKDYAALQRSVAGPDDGAKPRARPGGYEALTGKDGTPCSRGRGTGTPSSAMMRS
jgi:hypothetical protein